MINRVSAKYLINTKLLMRFGGGHHHHPVYDWREDHLANPDYVKDPRTIGVKLQEEYTYPFQDKQEQFCLSHPDDYDQKNLHTNMVGSVNWTTIAGSNTRQAPKTDYLADIAHEFDYESEDFDHQPENFKSQHFRKKGPLWMWVIACTAPLWFFGGQLFLQYWPEEDNWRYQRPPPLNFPDEGDTPDTECFKMFNGDPHRDFYDAGIVNAPWFQIKDGKKIYTKWAGVNQPRERI